MKISNLCFIFLLVTIVFNSSILNAQMYTKQKIYLPTNDSLWLTLLHNNEARKLIIHLENDSLIYQKVYLLNDNKVLYSYYRNLDCILFENIQDYKKIIEDEKIKKFHITLIKDEQYLYWFDILYNFIAEFIKEQNCTLIKKTSLYDYYLAKNGGIVQLNKKKNLCYWHPSQESFENYYKIFFD